LAVLGTQEDVATLVELVLTKKDAGERDQVAQALSELGGRLPDKAARCEPVLQALSKADAPTKVCLLTVLSTLGGDKALQAVRAALTGEGEVRKTAVRALADWSDAAPMPDLLKVAKEDQDPSVRILALRGYIRMAGLARDVAMFKTALESAKRTDEKKLALSGLGDVKDVAALNLLDPYVEDPALKEEAGAAAVNIGKDIGRRQAEAVRTILEKVVGAVKSNDTRRQAQDVLKGLPKKK
jgi:hypothetical protein